MKVGIVTGTFDILHAGHIHFLKEAKQMCDQLIVALQVDPHLERKNKNKPIESVFQRQVKLSACKYVDGIIVYEKEKDLPIIAGYFKPDIRFLGSDYGQVDHKPITDMDIPIEYIDSINIHSNDYH